MIESIKVKNFQSLQNVDLEFGKFTVIVGASSSGKSALTRALRAVASNALDGDNITRGTKGSAISVKTDSGTVTIERELGGSSAYKVNETSGKESRFTKLNRQVPTEVTEALGILPDTKEAGSINFAGQFDAPYLLKDGASSVATILGELTNVSTIFAAVKEANRRAKNASSLLNLRKKDLDLIVNQISDYSTVGQQAKQVTQAEELLTESIRLQSRIDLLKDLLDRASIASQALSEIKEIPTLPDPGPLLEAQAKINTFKDLLREVAKVRQIIVEQETRLSSAESDILQAEDELHQTLVGAGSCPLCNQKVD